MKGELTCKTDKKAGGEYPVAAVEDNKAASNNSIDKKDDTLVFLDDRRKKKVDETIETPDRYISRYHYDTKNLAQYLELCPHCRKPTLYTYRQVVVDSALDYLEEKEQQRGRHVNRSMFVGLTAGFLLVSAGLYYLLFHILSGARL
ncbi:MAG: hypothetical protein JSW26_24265 [Desulfobacterales bacterium]|nr:MAG: hypothetical protein JSW26_24265 [Desulfobacterales bacterium]